jgi:hypothetical protein
MDLTRRLLPCIAVASVLAAPGVAVAHHDAAGRLPALAKLRAVTSPLATVTWSGRQQRADDRVHALFGSEPQVKVVYAILKGRPNRFRAAAPLLQADAAAIDGAVAAATAGISTVRFDRGTSGGPQNLDIQVVQLSHRARAYYENGVPEVGRGSRLQRELAALTQLRPGRDLLVYVDGLGGTTVTGEADEVVADGRPGLENRSNRGGRIAAVFGPRTLPAPSADGLAPELALHELLHAFGAVQPDAPHATKGDHCYDGQDVMCYDDGSLRSGLYTQHACERLPGLVISAPIDCGSNDYFSAAPAAGSFLATHWNVFNSVFLGSCGDARLAPACGDAPATSAAVRAPAPAADVLSSTGPLQRTDTRASIADVNLRLTVADSSAVADISATPVTLPAGSYRIETCLTLATDGDQPWQQCWSRTTDGGPQRAPEESLTLTRPPSGSETLSGTVSIETAAGAIATTATPPSLAVPSA